ncbi:GumC family protein [Afipia sp. P52-10]|uniref:GumC family protein n=1 Tax=Afipia sp. P52-10 TaxID=1429916 RepID=UPI0009DE7585|nr:GumC family protein [Afipia sp. P52-10]
MLGRQAAVGPVDRITEAVPASRERPEAQPPGSARTVFLQRLSPAELIASLRRNIRQIAALALALFALGLALLFIIPARYTATSLIFVDPREQRVTTEQEVLPGIGQDTASLLSIIEIASSDGFLIPLIEKLDVAKDRDISGGETDMSELLMYFRKRLQVVRRGQTYVVAISFTSDDPQKAATYANAIAEAFVANQTKARTLATEEASDWLSSRLKTLRDRLTASEDAVAAFKTKHGIVEAGRDSTTRQVRATELSQLISAAKLRTEEAKARYDQIQRDARSNVDTSMGSRSELLNVLRTQRTQLNDQIAQKRAVFGDRHPDLVIALNQRNELERQIATERNRLVQAAKSDYETLRDQQKQLETLLGSVEGEMLMTGEAAVKLQDLRRQAEADRGIYEQFLARYKTTSEQRSLQPSQTQFVSAATVPARPNRPTLPVLIPAIAAASLLLAAVAVVLLDAGGVALPVAASLASLAAIRSQTGVPAPANAALDLPVWGVLPPQARPRPSDAASVHAVAPAPEAKANLAELLERIALSRGMRGRVVLFLAGSAGTVRTAVADALNALALERGMLSVLIKVEPSAAKLPADAAMAADTDIMPVHTTASSLMSLLSGRTETGVASGDVRSEFDIVVIDGTVLDNVGDIAKLADHIDFAVFVVDARTQDTDRITRLMDALARNRETATGVVIHQ